MIVSTVLRLHGNKSQYIVHDVNDVQALERSVRRLLKITLPRAPETFVFFLWSRCLCNRAGRPRSQAFAQGQEVFGERRHPQRRRENVPNNEVFASLKLDLSAALHLPRLSRLTTRQSSLTNLDIVTRANVYRPVEAFEEKRSILAPHFWRVDAGAYERDAETRSLKLYFSVHVIQRVVSTVNTR